MSVPRHAFARVIENVLKSHGVFFFCQVNTIAIALKGTEIVAACNAKITITGLLASLYKTNDAVALLETAPYFKSTGTWDVNGSLVLDVESFPADTAISFKFEVTNPASETTAGNIRIAIATPSMLYWNAESPPALIAGNLLPSQLMTMPARRNLRPITVTAANFVTTIVTATTSSVGDIFQSSPYPAKFNVITVSLQASVPLSTLCDVAVTIGPLTGACVSDDLALNHLGGLDVSDNSTVQRSWDASTYHLKLVIKANAIGGTTQQHLLHFSMQVKNPVAAQTSPSIFAQASGITMAQEELSRNLLSTTPSDIASGVPTDARPMHVRGLQVPNMFSVRNIGQQTAEPSAANVVTVTLATNIPLPAADPATKVTISGLIGASDFGGLEEASSKFDAKWDSARHSIVLDTTEDTDAGEEIVLKFKFKNPAFAQRSPRVYIEASGIAIAPMAMNPDMVTRVTTVDDEGSDMDANPGMAAPLAIFKGKLYARSVHQKQNGEYAGSENLLTFSFKSSVALNSSSSSVALVVNGLNGMRLADGSHSGVPVVTAIKGGDLFTCSSDSCAQAPRCLTVPYLDGSTPHAPRLTIGINNVPADTEIEFTVAFTNAITAQDCQSLTLETVSSDERLVFLPAPLHVKESHKTTNQCPLTIVPSALFTVKKVCQSVSCTGAVNTITISLQPSFDLTGAKHAEVTIRGLRGSTTRDSIVTLLSGAPTFEGRARWVQSSGMLILRVAATSTVSTTKVTVVRVDVANPKYAQAAAERVEISATGDVPHEVVCMDQCDGLAAPMRVESASFSSAAIASSTMDGGKDSTISVTLKPHCTVLCESRDAVITIEGLVGTTTRDSPALPVTMVKGSPALFMSSSSISLSFSSTCDLADNKVLIDGLSADPTGTMLYFADGHCAERYTKIEAFDASSGCATLTVTTNTNSTNSTGSNTTATEASQWSDGKKACELGVVSAFKVAQRGAGFKSGDFIVDSDTGRGLAGKCIVSGKDGGVDSISIDTFGTGYNDAVKVRCPRACPLEQEQQVQTCGCGSGCGCACSSTVTKSECGAPVDNYGMYQTVSVSEDAPKITSVCSWSQNSGRLTCVVQGCAKSTEDTIFTVSLANGLVNQPAQTVNIMASGHISIPSVALNGSAMQINTIAPGTTAVKMTMMTSLASWDGNLDVVVGSDGYSILEIVAAAAGVPSSKVTIKIEEITSVMMLTRSASYLKAFEPADAAKPRKLKISVTVDADDLAAASFIATGLTGERINAKLKASGASPVEVPEEHRAAVVETAADSVTAVCICRDCSGPQPKTTTGWGVNSTASYTPTCLVATDTGHKCTCTVELDNLPLRSSTTTYTLSSEMQCNGLAKITGFKIGTSSVASSSIVQAPDTCNDQCDSYHKVLTDYDVSSMVRICVL